VATASPTKAIARVKVAPPTKILSCLFKIIMPIFTQKT